MAKKLFIVESPNKAGHIKKILGASFDVVATKGHVADLPKKKIGVDPKKEFETIYEILPDRKQIVNDIVKKAKSAEIIYLATDLDREGEGIASNLSKYLPKNKLIKRVVYNSVTKDAILKAIDNARDLDMDLVAAYESRRILDRLTGYKCSFIVKQSTGGPSAGRVQSATLRFLAEREKEIQSFIPVEFWNISAEVVTKDFKKILARLTKPDKMEVKTEHQADKICDVITKGPVKVFKYEKIEVKNNPYAPFTSDTLIQSASSLLGWSPTKTMKVAQSIFEGSFITYHRTDSTFIVPDVINSIRTQVESSYGNKYIPSSARFYKQSKNAQEAHEAIRPTDISIHSASHGDNAKLYEMIWRRTLASQMNDSIHSRTKAEFECKDYILSSNASKCVFDGWRKVWNYGSIDNSEIPEFKIGDIVNIISINKEKDQTKPPSRYTEASVVKEMKKLGIGRPSTYASAIDTLKNRSYIETIKKSVHVTNLGIDVTDFLVSSNFCFVDLMFTANMEADLDEIAAAKKCKLSVLTDFYDRLKLDLKNAKNISVEKRKTKYKCPECDKNNIEKYLVKRFSKFGPFYSCETYPDCKYTAKIAEDGTPIEKVKKEIKYGDSKCPLCDSKMVIRSSKFGQFQGCEKYSKGCRGMRKMDGEEIKPKKKFKKKNG